MPIYIYRCNRCNLELEKLQEIGGRITSCSHCGGEMEKQPTFPAMIKIKGMGGYPSRRKMIGGTAAYSEKGVRRSVDNTAPNASDK